MKRIVLLSILSTFLFSCTYYLGPNRWAKSFPDDPVIVPHELATEKMPSDMAYLLDQEDLMSVAQRKLTSYSTKYGDTTLDARVVFAKLLLKQDIPLVNQTIMQYEAWGTTGTSHKLNKIGDYDFRQIIFVDIIGLFKDSPETLYPETVDHMINHLIIDNGNKVAHKAPKLMGLVRETENHILMKETSRYLKNQWLFEKYKTSEYNNEVNGMKAFMVEHLKEMIKTGFFEFNANPYISFTLEALHVLHKHTNDEEIKMLSKQVMDAENWQYALGSYKLKKYGPFRRRMGRASETSIYADRHGVMIRMELAKSNSQAITNDKLACCFDKALVVATSPYLLPQQTLEMITEKPTAYYAKIGHGLKGSPELYYGSPSFLMSAGGIRYGKRSQITPRPLTLFLDDQAADISECFHIKGKGKLNQWNNTGLYQNYMVGNQQVSIPEGYEMTTNNGIWQVYKVYPQKDIYVCVSNDDNFGALFVGDENYKTVLALNQSSKDLKKTFNFTEEQQVKYNIKSNKKWVIQKTPEGSVKRKYKEWQRFDVSFEEPAYSIK